MNNNSDARGLRADARELLPHGLGERLSPGQRQDHDHEVVDAALTVEMQEVAALDLLAVHGGGEDQNMVAPIGARRSRARTGPGTSGRYMAARRLSVAPPILVKGANHT